MEDREKIIMLYDYYGDLFNSIAKSYFESYYFDNLSLSEIAENENKSRNAIHKSIKNTIKYLYEYENKLKLYAKETKLKEIITKITDERIKKEIEELLWKTNYQYISII